jgi:predicted nucleotidyltransferase
MDKIIDTTLAKYLSLIKERFADIEKAYIFGSYAKGNPTEESDIDIALIFSNLDDKERFDIQVQLMLLAARIDSRIEPHPISHEDFDSGNPLMVEIKKTGIEVSDL